MSQGGIAPPGGGKRFGKGPDGDAADHGADAEETDEHVGNQQAGEDGKEGVAEGRTLEAVAKILDLGDVAVAFAEGPEREADEEKTGRMHERRPRGEFAEGADAVVEGLGGAAHHGKGGHRRAEDGHKEDDGAERAARDKVVGRAAAEIADTDEADRDHDREIEADDEGRNHRGGPDFTVVGASVGAGGSSRLVGQANAATSPQPTATRRVQTAW